MVGCRHCLHGFALRVSVHVLTANLMSDLNILAAPALLPYTQ